MTQELLLARELLTNITPLKTDCGETCLNACCATDEDGQGGVTLFPGESETLEKADWARIENGVLFCEGMCERELRPMGCRMFPLSPVPAPSGGWDVRMDSRARGMCPLCRSGIRGLDADFVDAVRRSFEILAKNTEMNGFLIRWYDSEREFRRACRLA